MAYFEFDNRKVFYKIEGRGKPILLLHGNTASSRMFDSVIHDYAKHFQLISLDFPGHGKSDRVEKLENDFWFYNAEVCIGLLKYLSLNKTDVIGTSGGALVAINLGLEHPEYINAIIADSFEGEFPLNTYVSSLEKDREMGKQDPGTRVFWESNHGSDWEKIVDQDTQMLLDFAQGNQSFFHHSISELKVPSLLTGSVQDEFCNQLDLIYSKLQEKNNILDIHLFEAGFHPAMLSNANAFLELVKQRLLP